MTQDRIYEDRQLFALIAEGDETAFAAIYRNYIPQLLPFISSIVRTEAIADEVIQETFLRLWVSRDKLPEVLEPRAWIFRIASNLCYTYIKRHLNERSIIQSLPGDDAVHYYEESNAAELVSLVKEAIDNLPPQRQKIYRLSREGGMSIQQIAEALNLSVPTVKNTISHSLKSIRDHLEEKGYSIPVAIIVLLFQGWK